MKIGQDRQISYNYQTELSTHGAKKTKKNYKHRNAYSKKLETLKSFEKINDKLW